jgi:hypothetical protein
MRRAMVMSIARGSFNCSCDILGILAIAQAVLEAALQPGMVALVDGGKAGVTR